MYYFKEEKNWKEWKWTNTKEDFIGFLAKRYCPARGALLSVAEQKLNGNFERNLRCGMEIKFLFSIIAIFIVIEIVFNFYFIAWVTHLEKRIEEIENGK